MLILLQQLTVWSVNQSPMAIISQEQPTSLTAETIVSSVSTMFSPRFCMERRWSGPMSFAELDPRALLHLEKPVRLDSSIGDVV